MYSLNAICLHIPLHLSRCPHPHDPVNMHFLNPLSSSLILPTASSFQYHASFYTTKNAYLLRSNITQTELSHSPVSCHQGVVHHPQSKKHIWDEGSEVTSEATEGVNYKYHSFSKNHSKKKTFFNLQQKFALYWITQKWDESLRFNDTKVPQWQHFKTPYAYTANY